MAIRTSKKTVTFRRPFVLGKSENVRPAGAYVVETDEKILEGPSSPVDRRTMTLIHLHEQEGHPGLTRMLVIDPNDLDAALKRDQAPADTPADTDTGHNMPKQKTESRRDGVVRLATEDREDGGMRVCPR